MKILIAITLLMLFSMTAAYAVVVTDTVNSNSDIPSLQCANSPPPSFCPNGTAIRTGTDDNGCSKWGCNKPSCVAIADCAQGYVPGDSYIDSNGCQTNKCVPATDCVKEGDSYPVAITPNSAPEQHCCPGLVPYSPEGYVGGAKCVKQLSPVQTCPANCECTGEVWRCEVPDYNSTKTCPANCQCNGEVIMCHIQDNKTKQNCPVGVTPDCEVQGLTSVYTYNADGCEIITCQNPNCPTLMPPAPSFITSCANGIQKQIKDGCVVGYTCVSQTVSPTNPSVCISNDHIQEMNNLLNDLKTAEQNNDAAQMDAIKAKIQDLQTQIQSDNQNCGAQPTTIVNPTQVSTTNRPTQDIVEYYKTKVAEIGVGNDVNTEVSQLKTLRSDIDRMINDLINNNTEINTTQMAPLVKQFYIASQSGSADGVSIPVSGKTFVATVDKMPYTINPTSVGVTIISDGVSAEATNVTIDNETLKVGNSVVNVLPNVAVAKYNIAPTDIKLVEGDRGPIYNVVSTEQRKIIGIISTDVTTNTAIDATSGDKLSESRPWWTFITTG